MSLVHLIKKSKNQNPDTEVVFDSNNIQSLAKDHNRILINLTDEREVEIKFQFPGDCAETGKSYAKGLMQRLKALYSLVFSYR